MKYLKKFNTKEEYKDYMKEPYLPNVSLVVSENNSVYFHAELPPLYIEAVEDLTITFSKNDSEYSLDNITWNLLGANVATPTIVAGTKVYFRARELSSDQFNGIGTFSTSGKCNIGGSIMSMLYGENYQEQYTILANYQFSYLFKNCLVEDASDLVLPATRLSDGCYMGMFQNCSDLIAAPKLPATNLRSSCYSRMYEGCSSLATASELPASTLASYCYYYMYAGCSNLSYVKMLATSISPTDCLTNWLSDVSVNGTFVRKSGTTWSKRGVSGIPFDWTIETADA